MGVSKVIYGGRTLIDLTADTIQADKLLVGFSAHGADGEPIEGSCDFDANTQDATAAAAEILFGKTAYNKAKKVTGTMKNNAAVEGYISTKDGRYVIPQGYHDGSGYAEISAEEKAKLISQNIRDGVTLLGVPGSMSGTEGANPQAKTVTPGVNAQEVLPDEGYNYLSSVTVLGIAYEETENSAGGKTVMIA